MTNFNITEYLRPIQDNKSNIITDHLYQTEKMSNHLIQRYERLLSSEKYSDCSFHAGGKTFNCHKLILSAASPVFEAMFFGPIKEENRIIDIVDISADIFKHLLTHIYTGQIYSEKLSLEDALQLYLAAEKYLLEDLQQDCLTMIERKLRYTNILPTLELCVSMHLSRLRNVCLSFFRDSCLRNAEFMQHIAEHYEHVSKNCIKEIIAYDSYMLRLDMYNLLRFVNMWCAHECMEKGLPDMVCLLKDLQKDIKQINPDWSPNIFSEQQIIYVPTKSVQRLSYKATCPLRISHRSNKWRIKLWSTHNVLLKGLIINSRLPPCVMHKQREIIPKEALDEYKEQFQIEIKRRDAETEHVNLEDESIFSYEVKDLPTKYNCDLHIRWTNFVDLDAHVEHTITFSWLPQAYGAEYPCSFQSNVIEGFRFSEPDTDGSLLKGLYYDYCN